MTALTLDQASTIVDKALEKGRELKLHPLTVVVLDAGGDLVAMKREDRSGILRTEIATGKAWGTLGMGFGGREFARRAAAGGVFLQALMAASGGRVVPAPGGVLHRDGAGPRHVPLGELNIPAGDDVVLEDPATGRGHEVREAGKRRIGYVRRFDQVLAAPLPRAKLLRVHTVVS